MKIKNNPLMISSKYVLRLISLPVFLVMLVVIFSCTSSPGSNEQVTILEGATLFDGMGARPVENSVVVINGDTIDCDDCTIPENGQVIDISGKYITPGLIDAHVHFFQTGFFDSRPDALDLRDTYPFSKVAACQKQHPQRYYNSYLCSGITGVQMVQYLSALGSTGIKLWQLNVDDQEYMQRFEAVARGTN